MGKNKGMDMAGNVSNLARKNWSFMLILYLTAFVIIFGMHIAYSGKGNAAKPDQLAVTVQGNPYEGLDPVYTPEAENVEVICPAIGVDDRARTNALFEPVQQPELVVLGKVTNTRETPGGEDLFTVAVEKVLYGSWDKGTLTFNDLWSRPAEKGIFLLVPEVYASKEKGDFYLKDVLGVAEEKAIKALYDARLDYNTLAAKYIFVGKEIQNSEEYISVVKVTRPILGTDLKQGDEVRVRFGGYIQESGQVAHLRETEEIYFISFITQKRGQPDIYELSTRQPADQIEKVVQSLNRREEYPLQEIKDGEGNIRRYREVMFRGSLSEAVEILGSASEGASTLAARRLLYNADDACPLVVSAMEKQMFEFAEPEYGRFRHLKLLVKVLGGMDNEKAEEALGKLIDKTLIFIGEGHPEPPETGANTSPENEEHQDNANHILAWLLMEMDEAEVLDKYGNRLQELRDNVQGNWKKEVQLALDASRVEDNLELQTAYARMKDVKPVRSVPPLQAKGEQVVFSPDGKFLAVDGNVFNTNDWSKASDFKGPSWSYGSAFSPDGKFLYLTTGGCVRIDCRTGEIDKIYAGRENRITRAEFSADGQTIAAGNHYEDIVHVWNAETGQTIRSFEQPDECFAFALSPDGKMLALQVKKSQVNIEPIAGGDAVSLSLGEGKITLVVFSPDGKFLAVACLGEGDRYIYGKRQPIVLNVYEATAGFKLKARASFNDFPCTSMAFSPNSEYLAFGTFKGGIRIFSMPDLEGVAQLGNEDNPSVDSGSMAFSPDGNMLVIGNRYDVIHLFTVPGFLPFHVGTDHSGEIKDLYFQANGETILTIGKDETVCLRNAATLEVVRQFSLPTGHTFISARPSDGRYAFCASTDLLQMSKIVDMITGEVVSEVNLPINWRYRTSRLIWLDDNEALCLANGRWRRFNYLTGEILDDRKVDIGSQNELFNGLGKVTEDKKHLFLWDTSGGPYVCREIEVWTVDIASMEPSATTKCAQIIRGGYNKRGIVPGGKYFYMADPDMYILSRETGKLVAYRSFRQTDLLNAVFSPDGEKYAVITGGRIFVDNNLRQWDPETESVVRIHETVSGKTLFAFPAPSRWVRKIKFSPDSKRLALVGSSGVIEVWNLSP